MTSQIMMRKTRKITKRTKTMNSTTKNLITKKNMKIAQLLKGAQQKMIMKKKNTKNTQLLKGAQHKMNKKKKTMN